MQFTRKTYAYFDEAQQNAFDRAWFERNQELYTQFVEVPFEHLARSLHARLAGSLPGISFSTRKITRPTLRIGKESSGPVVRDKATAFFSEASTSMFENNPGIYVSLGVKADDNVIGCGLYMPSARQFRELRPRLAMDPPELRALLADDALLSHWGGLQGDRFTRYPKGFDETTPGAAYLMHKQWLLSKVFKRSAVTRAGFLEEVVDAFAAALPFLAWTRNAVGLYKKAKAEEL